MQNMLGFLGAIGLSLSTDKASYKIGDSVIYKIQGAIPGAQIAWTSYKNGQPTGEYNASYGQTVGANGTAELTGGVWADGDVGQWQKEAVIINPDGTLSNAITSFSVSPKTAAPPVPGNVPGSTDFFSGNVTLPIVGSVSKPVAIIGGLGLAFLLFGKKGR